MAWTSGVSAEGESKETGAHARAEVIGYRAGREDRAGVKAVAGGIFGGLLTTMILVVGVTFVASLAGSLIAELVHQRMVETLVVGSGYGLAVVKLLRWAREQRSIIDGFWVAVGLYAGVGLFVTTMIVACAVAWLS